MVMHDNSSWNGATSRPRTADGDGSAFNAGLLVAHSPRASSEELTSFARQAADDARPVLEDAADVPWRFHLEEPVPLSDAEPRRPSDFLDDASRRMVEGPYDVVIVVTDAPLVSRRRKVVPGLATPPGRVAVVSTRKLTTTSRERPTRPLDSPAVRWNAATLLAHLVGHLFGLGHADGDATMAPFRFDESRRAVPRFDPRATEIFARRGRRDTHAETVVEGTLGRLAFHARSALGHPRELIRPLVRNRAPLLALSLPSLATAAVAPTFILVFTAEIWDVGVNMTNAIAAVFALASVLGATAYFTVIQDLFFPRKEKRVLTQHIAVVNVTILLTVLSALVGLFVMVALLMLAVELYIFPPGLIRTWPSLEDPVVDLVDLVRTAGFISTVGMITGALAGGLESRTVIRHLALFLDRP